MRSLFPGPEHRDTRWITAFVGRLRWVLPLAIFLVVLLHQAWETAVADQWPPAWRFTTGLLFYGLIGPLVTFWTLDWIARALAEQDAIETRARRGERYLASITNSSADAIFSLDNNDVVQSWNRGAVETFGYEPDEMVGRHVSALLPEDLRLGGEVDVIRERLLGDGFVRGYQTRCLRKDGAAVSVDLTETLLLGESGDVVGSSVIMRDITAQREAEAAVQRLNRELEERVIERTRQLEQASAALRAKNEALVRANAELKQLDALKDEFVDLVSHELRAPLTNINASVELMLARSPDDGSRTKLEIIGEEASRLTRLVQSVLDVSRMEAGRLHLLTAPVDPDRLCHTAVRRVSAGDGARNWHVAVAAGTPAVLADEDRAGQALCNLLENAAKYSPPDSPVEVGARPAPNDQAVLFSVADRGTGIPAEELDRVFERFHRVERGDAKETYGHGLGLYIAHKIVELHGGRMWVESALGQGTTFLFTLPSTPEDP